MDHRVRVVKTHYPERLGFRPFEGSKAILLVRNPFDAIDSYFNMALTNTHDQRYVCTREKQWSFVFFVCLLIKLTVCTTCKKERRSGVLCFFVEIKFRSNSTNLRESWLVWVKCRRACTRLVFWLGGGTTSHFFSSLHMGSCPVCGDMDPTSTTTAHADYSKY